jgi:hypothetical protein
LIKDVPDGPGDRRPDGPRTIATLVAALAATLLAATIAGCGGEGGESSTGTGASVSTATTSSSQAKSTTTGTRTTGQSGSGKSQHSGGTPHQTVNSVLTSVGPANCAAGIVPSANVTEHFVHAAYGDTGGCIRAQNQGAVARSLGSYTQETNGSAATVKVRPVGGVYDGEKLTVSLVKEDGSWKVDSMKSNAPVGP